MSNRSVDAETPGRLAEFRAARERAALFDRRDRSLLIATGRDRRDWLHNLVTNAVKTLADGAGCYAFACDVRGRIQFDLNILARSEALWLDVDANFAPAALKHLDHYLLSEDVRLHDATAEYGRLAVCGPACAALAARLGVADLAALAPLAHCDVAVAAGSGRAPAPATEAAGATPARAVEATGPAPAHATEATCAAPAPATAAPRGTAAGPLRGVLLRHDFAGPLGFELITPTNQHAAWCAWLAAQPGVSCADSTVLEILRIDAGLPALGRDLDATVVAPESGQVDRAISYHKGCYLGQEVIERMRSHGALARRLVRLEAESPGGADSAASLLLPAVLMDGDAEAGRLTSLAWHPLEQKWIALGIVRTRVPVDAVLRVADSPLRFRQRPHAARPELT